MSRAPHRPSNAAIAEQLDEVADRLQAHDASEFRVRAYREAARELRRLPEPVIDRLDREGLAGLVRIPTIGRSIARAIEEMAWRGRWSLLDRLRGEVTPEDLFMTLPGVGEQLASRFHRELDVETLEGLEVAAHDGRLEAMRGIGPRRTRAIRDLLAVQLGRAGRPRMAPGPTPARAPSPPVELLLRLDDEYRTQAAAGGLPTLTPKRFNPTGAAWLPIWHPEAGGFHFTLLFSSSQRAHELDKTRDWVVVHWDRDGEEGQATVVTEYRGPLRGRRVVRGRERECLTHWAHETEVRARRERRRPGSTR